MSNIPKTRIRRTLGRDAAAAFFGPTRHRWEVTLGDRPIAEFDNHPDALTYAHRRATTAQREHVEKLERDAYEARRAAEEIEWQYGPSQPNAEQIKGFIENAGLPISGWQTSYLTGLLQKRHP